MLGRNEFALRQGFGPRAQNACTAQSANRQKAGWVVFLFTGPKLKISILTDPTVKSSRTARCGCFYGSLNSDHFCGGPAGPRGSPPAPPCSSGGRVCHAGGSLWRVNIFFNWCRMDSTKWNHRLPKTKMTTSASKSAPISFQGICFYFVANRFRKKSVKAASSCSWET